MDIIIGICGHIDHGKTTLIKNLNGFVGDSTKEEQRRGITIDVSYSSLDENGKNISFIDVPGHESLVKNMISASFSFSYVLFVVDINEGMMPQSFEHLLVLKILGIKNVILVLTKCDKNVADKSQEIIKSINDFGIQAEKIFKTTLNNTGGLKEYLLSLEPKKSDDEILKLYVDRSFNKKGEGSIIAGTLLGGEISVDDKLYSSESKDILRVKALQNHGKDVLKIKAPARVAMLISSKKDIKKGDFICKKGEFKEFDSFDCILQGDINHNQNYIIAIGSKLLNAKVSILGDNYASIKLEKKIVSFYNQKFILLSSGRVKGGGSVLNPVVEPMKKELKIELLKSLEKNDYKQAFLKLSSFHRHGFGLLCAMQRFGIDRQKALDYAKELDVIVDEKNYNIYQKSVLNDIKQAILKTLSKNKKALFSASSISYRLPWASEFLCQIVLDDMQTNEILECKNGCYFDKNYDYESLESDIKDTIYQIILGSNITPPAPYNIYDELDIDRKTGDNALKTLCKQNKVLRLEHNLFVESKNLSNFIDELKPLLKDGVDVGVLKDRFNLSRKYAIAYLEYLDKQKGVFRVDNKRFLK